jgi:hypothetical protein
MPDSRITTTSLEPREHLGEKTWLLIVTTNHPDPKGYGYEEVAIFECSTSTLAENLASFIRDNSIHIGIDSDH